MASKMAPFQKTVQTMMPYPSTNANVVHIKYQEPGVIYDQPDFTYEYITYRGNAQVRVRRGVVMEANNGSL